MNRLVFAASGWSELRQALLVSAPLESAAVLLVNAGHSVDGLRLIVSEVLWPQPADYSERSPTSAVLRPGFVAQALQRARREGQSIFLVHTHPFEDWPRFSKVDDRGEAILAPTLFQRCPIGTHGSLVIGPRGFAGRLFDAKGLPTGSLDRIVEAGADVRIENADATAPNPSEVYDRNVRAFGSAGQQLLLQLKVGVVGVGGTGSFAVEELSRLGVGHLLLIDDEVIETTNLNRVIGSTTASVGTPKVEVALKAAKHANPEVRVSAVQGSILYEENARMLLDCDLVFCCTDSHGSRALLNQIAYQFMVPMIDIGVRIDARADSVTTATTRVQMLAPGLACLVCHPLLDPVAVRQDLMSEASRGADPYIVGFHEPQPAVVSINGAATSAAVTLFLMALTGLPGRVRHMVGRPLDGIVRPIQTEPLPTCVVCGSGNALGQADHWKMMWLPRHASS